MKKSTKVVSQKEALALAARARKAGRTVVATNGCFDILHVGHIRNLQAAKALGDVLIVGINSDVSVRKNKGLTRPIVPERERAEMLAALESVDYVFIFNEKTPFSWIKKLKPHIHVKGGGQDVLAHPDFPAQQRVLKSVKAKFVLLPHAQGKSTTRLMQKILGEK